MVTRERSILLFKDVGTLTKQFILFYQMLVHFFQQFNTLLQIFHVLLLSVTRGLRGHSVPYLSPVLPLYRIQRGLSPLRQRRGVDLRLFIATVRTECSSAGAIEEREGERQGGGLSVTRPLSRGLWSQLGLAHGHRQVQPSNSEAK